MPSASTSPATLEIPTLVLWGDSDRIADPATGALAATPRGQARVGRYGHWMFQLSTERVTTFCVDITCSTSYTVVMAKRNLTIQLDEATIRHAKVVAAHRGLSLSSLVAQQLNGLAEADQRYERARAVALGALADATGGGAPIWRREELYDL